ncbi:FAD-dependent oxidoreductase [Limibaculum sp. M0105]|uniref:FAD-dependent oxidoreductase n=1 Tax=Thermohalobaculum xanthum TaxID=2753746 RepID=A0A8J7M8Y9_9RHOB|nr:FAD-dependent oxidoreductase [Thermohalobaculum xanthum]MBK0400328.1 FAD-dependent oxidoreductase [Thermohalobaculum xanthum]
MAQAGTIASDGPVDGHGDVLVVGAGVAGLCTATELMARGARVTVVDRAPGPGPASCSWWAGGMLAPYCERESAEEPVLRFGRLAADWWERHAGGVTRAGTLVVAPGRDRAELARFARRTSGFEEVTGARITELEPDLEGRFGRGLFFPDEAHLDPRAATAALLGWLEAGGARVLWGTSMEDAPSAGQVIDCRGLAAADTLPGLRGVKGEMLVIRSRELRLSRPVRLLHPRWPIYIVPRGDGVYMLGATMIESDDRNRITARSMLELLGAAYALHPAFAEAEVLEIGVDARPAFADNLPRVVRRDGRLHVNGLYRHGFLLGPTVGAEAAAAAMGANHGSEWIDDDHSQR